MDERLERLRVHCVGLCTEVIWPEITAEGCILVRDYEGAVYKDGVTTHHLVDLLHTLNRQLFSGNIRRACQWFTKERADLADPFFVTSLAACRACEGDTRTKVADAILKHRRPSGLIEIYTAFLDSGSLFATLWAVKILLLLQQGSEFEAVVRTALQAVRERWQDLHRVSFRGFYLDVVLQSKFIDLRPDAERVSEEIVSAQDEDGLWDGKVLYSAYVAANLLSSAQGGVNEGESLRAADRCLDRLFDLHAKVKGIPTLIRDVASSSVESAYLQSVIRCVKTGCRRLAISGHDVSADIAMSLLGTWPTLYHATGALDSRLKQMLQQYGEIEKQFQRQEQDARPLLANTPYERNVFVMMPLRQQEDQDYERIELIIREELKKKGFRAWLATDRELAPTLWDNITAYMTGCKHGVAIFTRRDDVAKGTIEADFNPNVSLELGFMLSRAKRVLLLKDKPLKTLPTDLMGRLYREFDLRQVERQLPPIVASWADELLAAEPKPPEAEAAAEGAT